jgi:hypothetical protein
MLSGNVYAGTANFILTNIKYKLLLLKQSIILVFYKDPLF